MPSFPLFGYLNLRSPSMPSLLSTTPSILTKTMSPFFIFSNKQSLKTPVCLCYDSKKETQISDSDSSNKKRGMEKGEKAWLLRFLGGVEKVGRGLKDSMAPKQKGDWKDVVLMSLSFAVYVYISQKIVCAYCAWISILKHYN